MSSSHFTSFLYLDVTMTSSTMQMPIIGLVGMSICRLAPILSSSCCMVTSIGFGRSGRTTTSTKVATMKTTTVIQDIQKISWVHCLISQTLLQMKCSITPPLDTATITSKNVIVTDGLNDEDLVSVKNCGSLLTLFVSRKV